ncbi:glycosyltransferase, group 2 family protein [Peptostreptococcaceae bacterium AS15]|nr:glycosyltransferase, group 2 family protein [Peptostreptococcaceae bacterium AS15]
MKIALCLITWNEIDGVKHDIPLIDKSKFEQIYCIDGGSTDGTVEYLEENGIKVYTQQKKGINQACLEAVEHCECDAFVFFHPKGTIPVEDIYKFREFYEAGYEFVVGSRMMKGAHNEEDDQLIKPRKWFVLCLALLSKILFKREGNTVWDVLHGFRGMTLESFKKLNISDYDKSIDIEMVNRSYKFKSKRIEFPTYETSRIGGETHFKALSTGWQVLKYMWWEFRRKN